VLTGARRKFRDNNGLCAMVQFSQFHTRGGGDGGLSHAALPASMRINLRLCKTAPLDRLLGRSSGLRNLQQFVTERIEGKKPETNRARRNCDWIGRDLGAWRRMRKGREQELRARQEKSPSAISREGGTRTEA